ncbi:TPA: hypothetical protein ACF2DE_002967 [Clostridium perfringens]
MKKYKILDCESTRDFAESLINKVFELVAVIANDYLEKNLDVNKKCLNYLILDTYDGELIFAPDEVEEEVR